MPQHEGILLHYSIVLVCVGRNSGTKYTKCNRNAMTKTFKRRQLGSKEKFLFAFYKDNKDVIHMQFFAGAVLVKV